jgi:hypothetical protein
LTWEDVLLAAYVGHPGAVSACRGARRLTPEGRVWSGSQAFSRRVFAGRGPRPPLLKEVEWRDQKAITRIGDWAYGLGSWGKPVMLLAAVAAAEAALPAFEAKYPGDPCPRRAVGAAASVLQRGKRIQPGRVRSACRAALKSARAVARDAGFQGDLMPGTCREYDAACAANQAAKLAHLMLTLKMPSEGLPLSLKPFPYNFVASRAVRYAAGAVSVRRVRESVRNVLVEHALSRRGRMFLPASKASGPSTSGSPRP